jgi:hypothetical protein
MKRLALILAGVVCAALPCLAGGNLSVRLVEGSDAARGGAGGLEDVMGVLKQNLKYKHYRLVAAASLSLPTGKTTRALGDYGVTCTGKQQDLAITVVDRQRRKQVLKTTVNLRDNKPLIVGGFPSERGKMILVFVVK